MLEKLTPGTELDGFVIGERIHSGAQGMIFSVTSRAWNMPLIMKVPRVGRGETSESLLNFETEAVILPALTGPHVPHFIAAGDLTRTPYLVTEWIEGESLEHWLKGGPLPVAEVVRIGATIADALHSIHLQDTIHLDLKPENVILKRDGTAVLIDFGLAHHARYPDLLAEEKRFAAGSAPYISPEQVQDTRSDSRSDIFSLGVVLYEMATGELPFGLPQTMKGMRDRLWREPVPPRALAGEVPPWLQEIILHCLEINAEDRYQSAAYVAFDLRNPEQVTLTGRATKLQSAGFFGQLKRWWRARDHLPVRRSTSRLPASEAPIVMVAVDTSNPDDPRHPALQRTTSRVLSLSNEFRLVCVSAIRAPNLVEGAGGTATASGLHLEHLVRLRHWVEPLGLPPTRLSLHVIESANAADTLLDFAQRNNVNLIVLGAPGPKEQALAWWRSVASTVTAKAHCSVHVVRIPERNDRVDAGD